MKLVRRLVVAAAAVVATVLLLATGLVLLAVRREGAALDQIGVRAPILDPTGRRVRDLDKNGEIDPYEDPSVPVEERTADLLGRMSIAEKVGLMLQPSIFMEKSGRVVDAWGGAFVQGFGTAEAILARGIRHFELVNAESCRATAAWHNEVQRLAERTRLGIPVTISSHPRHGVREEDRAAAGKGFSRWPAPLGLAATRDPDLARRFAQIANREYRAVGIRTALHPVADLATEPRWARVAQTFGENAELAARMVAAYVEGFQGPEPGAESVLCMTKHFPGAGPQKDGLDPAFSYGAEQVDPGAGREAHLIPFTSAIAAGTAQMMPTHGVLDGAASPGVAASYDREILTGLLRERLGFRGVVCTPWRAVAPEKIGPFEVMHARAFGVEDLSVTERYRRALEAGVDQFGGEADPEPLIELVRSGAVSMERLDESVARILRDKLRLGLFDDPYVDPDAAEAVCDQPAFREAGDDAQRRSIVLLQNEERRDGTPFLPLPEGSAKVFVEGIDASVAAHYGTVVPTLEEADFAVVRIDAPHVDRRPETVGDWLLNATLDQGSLDLPPEDLERLRAMARARPAVVAVRLDRPAILTPLVRETAGLLAHFGASDAAILDVVFGRVRPSGKLPVELPSSMDAVRSQKEDLPRDSPEPLFPYGFGLTYEAARG